MFGVTSGMWTWLTGSSGINQVGVYGTRGLAAAGNRPGGRNGHSMTMGNEQQVFYVMGGYGYGTGSSKGKASMCQSQHAGFSYFD